jgi:hypothetical protein
MATTITPIFVSDTILTGSASGLVVTRDMIRNFGSTGDYVEMHLLDPADKIIFSVSPFTNYKIPAPIAGATGFVIQELEFDPEQDLKNLGVQFGRYKIVYNILRPKLVFDDILSLFITEISGDRTEIRLDTNNIGNTIFRDNIIDFINEFQSLRYFREFYLNFGLK